MAACPFGRKGGVREVLQLAQGSCFNTGRDRFGSLQTPHGPADRGLIEYPAFSMDCPGYRGQGYPFLSTFYR